MSFRILTVCSANTCRSPLMEVALDRGFERAGLGNDVVVWSAGVRASPGYPVCGEMLARVMCAGQPRFLQLERHRSVRVTDALIAEADLILTADRQLRASVLRHVGNIAGERTFTLREAAGLASERVPNGNGATAEERLRAVTLAMHETRGFIDLPGSHRISRLPRPWPAAELHDHDIPDGHEAPAASHRLIHRLVMRSAEQLSAGMVAGLHQVRR